MDYPNDADGDALRRVVEMGADMSEPMDIDFSIEAPDGPSAEVIAEGTRGMGYRTKVSQDEDADMWSCYCTCTMIATYDGVVAVQAELDSLSRRHGGCCGGWGTFGNAGQVVKH